MNYRNFNDLCFTLIIFFASCIFANDDQAQLYTSSTIKREDNSSIIYYLSTPKKAHSTYPLVILCEGSYSMGEPIHSVLRLHKLFLPLLEQAGYALLTVEKWGVGEGKVNQSVFHEHNTRSQRIEDHQTVLNYLKKSSFVQASESQQDGGWNGKYVFIGGSEGGDIITALTIINSDSTVATINYAGMGVWGWRNELWSFLQHSQKHSSFVAKLFAWWSGLPKTREQYDKIVEEIIKNPTHEKWWLGQTYKYMSDAFLSKVDWDVFYSLKIPMLIVMGSLDPAIDSCDEFVARGTERDMLITYWRMDDMGHNIGKKRPETFAESIAWLMKNLKN